MTASRGKAADQVAGFVLAGGRSSRMGREKALLEIAGVPLVVRAVRRLEPQVHAVKVMGPAASLAALGVSLLPDKFPGSGPLGAIATALAGADRPWSLVVACDMPYLSAEWLEYLVGRALDSKADVVLPESAYQGTPLPEPLCALYHQRAGASICTALERGARKVMHGLAGLNIERISPEESKPFDSEGLLFQNLNSPEEFEAARTRIEARERD